MQRLINDKRILVAVMAVLFAAIILVATLASYLSPGRGGDKVVGTGVSQGGSSGEDGSLGDGDKLNLGQLGTGDGADEQVIPITYNAPDEMRAVYLTPGEDFFASGDRSEAKVKAEIDAALQKAQDLTMNTVILKTAMEHGVIYTSRNLPQVVNSFDPLAYAISAAKSRGLYV